MTDKDKRARLLKDGTQKLKESQRDLTGAAVDKLTDGSMTWPSFEDVNQASSDAAHHLAKASRDGVNQREEILEEHGKQEVRAALAMLQRGLSELKKVAEGGENGESWKAGVPDDD